MAVNLRKNKQMEHQDDNAIEWQKIQRQQRSELTLGGFYKKNPKNNPEDMKIFQHNFICD